MVVGCVGDRARRPAGRVEYELPFLGRYRIALPRLWRHSGFAGRISGRYRPFAFAQRPGTAFGVVDRLFPPDVRRPANSWVAGIFPVLPP